MKAIVNSKQMKAIDEFTINEVLIPAIVLMERAALKVAETLINTIKKEDKILAVCGLGNNGADGIAAARILYTLGYNVDIYLVGDEQKASSLVNEQLSIARNLYIPINNNKDIFEYTIIIDAIFGIGLNKPVSGRYKEIIENINEGKYIVYSVDIPSGLSADTGKPMGIAIKADYTITFGFLKIGLLMYPGCEYAGTVHVSDIGFPKLALDSISPNHFIMDESYNKYLPVRVQNSNKGTYGKVLIIAGSKDMSGACYFSAYAAFRTGAGLVKIVTASENRQVLQTQLPEAIMTTYSSDELNEDQVSNIVTAIKWSTVVVIGPGISGSEVSMKLLDIVLNHAKVPIIIDADGLNLLSQKLNKEGCALNNQDRVDLLASYLPKQTILTPHLKELSRLINMSVDDIKENIFDIANSCTQNNHLLFALKDARTVVAYRNERFINTTGNNGMSTAGSGDILTGIIAALIAQGKTPYEATTLGVYLHGLAGDVAADEKGTYSLIASDIINALSKVLKN